MIKFILASNLSILNCVDNVVYGKLLISEHGGKHLLYILDILLFVHCVFFNVETFYQVLTDLVHMNLCVLKNKDPSALDQSIRKTLNGKC